MTPSKIFLYFCLSFISGIFLNSIIFIPQILMLVFLIFGLILISIFWQYKKLVIIGFCILFLVLGMWRHQISELQITNGKLQIYNDKEEIITLTGVVAAEPDIREKSQKLIIKVKEIQTYGPVHRSTGGDWGKVLVTINRYPEYQYGDKLEIVGKFATPPVFEGFDYQDYLKKEGIYSVMSWPEVKLLERNQGNLVYAKILQFKNKLRESIYQNLSPPQSSILGAVVLGDKRKISEEWKEKLNIAGVRHITAVSGLHVAILTVILMNLLIWLGFWRQQAFYFTIILITFFVVMTGFQPSAIRAGIMGGLFLLGSYLGRLSVSSRAIVLAAALMLLQKPLLLRLDIGFQLSFLAMLGIIYLLPVFKEWLKFIPLENLKSILAMTFSAYLFTLPVLIYNFGYVSLVAPITNILIVPTLYWIMLFGFVFGIVGMVWETLGWIFSLPAWLLLTYLTKVADLFSQSWAFKTIENVHWLWLIISYLILGVLVWWLNKRQRLKFLNY